jgi:hypothetical protein
MPFFYECFRAFKFNYLISGFGPNWLGGSWSPGLATLSNRPDSCLAYSCILFSDIFDFFFSIYYEILTILLI